MALAEVVLDLVNALGPVLARIRDALVNVQLTVLPTIASATAIAPEATQLIDAVAAVQAGITHAVVDVYVTDASCHSRYAVAGEVIDHIDAGGAVRAGIADALVNVDLTVLALIARLADTFVGIDLEGTRNLYSILYLQ